MTLRRFVHITIAVCVGLFLFPSCGGGRQQAFLPEGDTLALRHATHLTMVEYDGYTLAVVRNPWDTTRVLHTYVLVEQGRELPEAVPEGTVVRVPLSRAVVYTAVHCALLDEWGKTDAIAGVCDLSYISLPAVQHGCRMGRIQDLGSGMAPDVERLIDLHPDALLLSPFENSGGYGRVDRLGVPIVECADYMEHSALGRAEWVRFYGRLFGCAGRADSMFAAVERDYLQLKRRAQACVEHPTVLTDLPMSASAWYVPGGASTVGRMYADAGARFLFADNGRSGSVPCSFETVFERAQDADCWLIRYNAQQDHTYTSLQQEYAPYGRFRAFRERQMYGCNTGNTPFYEEVPFHPERLLSEMVQMFHPSLRPDTLQWRYYKPLEE